MMETCSHLPLRKPPLRRSSEFDTDSNTNDKPKRIDYYGRKFIAPRVWYPRRANNPLQYPLVIPAVCLDPISPKKVVVEDAYRSERFSFFENRRKGRFDKRNQIKNQHGAKSQMDVPKFTQHHNSIPFSPKPWTHTSDLFNQQQHHTLNHLQQNFHPPCNNLPPLYHSASHNVPIQTMLPSFPAKSIIIRQDEDIPPRFRRKIRNFENNTSQIPLAANNFDNNEHNSYNNQTPLHHVSNPHLQANNPIHGHDTQPIPYRSHIQSAFEDNRKCRSNDSHYKLTDASFPNMGRRCQSTAYLPFADYKSRNNIHHSNWRVKNDRPSQIPLSAYITATNQLEKRESRLIASEMALDCCDKSGRQDIFSPYRLDEDDVSLFGSESPFTVDMKYSSLNAQCGSLYDDTLDEDKIDETIVKLERELKDNKILNIDDFIKDSDFNDDSTKMVYKTKDFMQWAQLYFNSQLKKKIDPKILDWASKHSSTSSLAKQTSVSETIDEEDESQTDSSREIFDDVMDYEDSSTEILSKEIKSKLVFH